MNESTNEKILYQVVDIFRGVMTVQEAVVLALQLLFWARMSNSVNLPGGLKIQAKCFADPHWVRDVWNELGKRSRMMDTAYSNWQMPSRLDPPRLGAAIDLCIRLADTGVLDKFDPTDCFSNIIGREATDYFLPPELADIMTVLAKIETHACVYIPWGNSIQMGVRAAKIGASVYMETMQESQLSALISMFIDGEIEIAYGDPIREPSAVEGGKLRIFDNCVAFPPIGVRYKPDVFERDWYGRFREKTSSGTVLAVWHIMAQTRGRAVIAIPNSLLFSPGGDRSIREELLSRGLIEAIIAMPSGLFCHTNISFALLVLNMNEFHQTIRFVNAEDDRFREPISKARAKLIDIDGIIDRVVGNLTDELVAEATREEIFANDTILQVNRYVLPASSKKTEQLLASSQTRSLAEIVSILRPMPTVSSEDAIKAWEVGAADLLEFAYIAPPAKEVRIDPSTAQRNKHQFLQPFDIVLIIKGSVGKVGIVPNDLPLPGEGGWVVGQSAVILRITNHDLMDPKTLVVYLRSPLGRELLERIAVKGATIPLIQQRELLRLQVVIPAKKEAAEIGNILDEQAILQREIESLRKRQIKLTKQVWTLD